MEVKFEAKAKLIFEITSEGLKCINVGITCENDVYFGKTTFMNGAYPTDQGCAMMAQAFLRGIVGCIHESHEKGYKDKFEFLQLIIDQLKEKVNAEAVMNYEGIEGEGQ